VSSTKCLCVGAFAGLVLVSCAVRSSNNAPSKLTSSTGTYGYVDLQPGWRVRAVTPITKSGTSTFTTESVEAGGSSLSMKASQDFVGYEISYYAVNTRPGGGVSIHFSSAEIKKEGKKIEGTTPVGAAVRLALRCAIRATAF
jgi:hypothetical protein